jgi:hypothetical protein
MATLPAQRSTAAARLDRAVKEELRLSGFTQAAWARRFGWADGVWHGDACGCFDDRCTGYHHDADQECRCFAELLAEAVNVG